MVTLNFDARAWVFMGKCLTCFLVNDPDSTKRGQPHCRKHVLGQCGCSSRNLCFCLPDLQGLMNNILRPHGQVQCDRDTYNKCALLASLFGAFPLTYAGMICQWLRGYCHAGVIQSGRRVTWFFTRYKKQVTRKTPPPQTQDRQLERRRHMDGDCYRTPIILGRCRLGTTGP